jgi:ABC-type glycerol-3-phosphate transport system substrate-binding protein
MARGILIRMAAIVVVLALLIVACGPTPAPEAVEKVVTETVVVEKEVEKEVVKFVVWPQDDFGIQTLEELAETFNETYGIEVDLIFLSE